MYAATTWPSLSASQRRKFAVRYYSPLRKAVDGSWAAEVQPHPLTWDEVLSRAQRPAFEVALAAARLRFLARLPRAPPALVALLQLAGASWRAMVVADLTAVCSVLGSAVASLPAPTVSLQPWLDIAAKFPIQWQQLIKRFVAKMVEAQHAQFQLGYRTVIDDFDSTLSTTHGMSNKSKGRCSLVSNGTFAPTECFVWLPHYFLSCFIFSVLFFCLGIRIPDLKVKRKFSVGGEFQTL